MKQCYTGCCPLLCTGGGHRCTVEILKYQSRWRREVSALFGLKLDVLKDFGGPCVRDVQENPDWPKDSKAMLTWSRVSGKLTLVIVISLNPDPLMPPCVIQSSHVSCLLLTESWKSFSSLTNNENFTEILFMFLKTSKVKITCGKIWWSWYLWLKQQILISLAAACCRNPISQCNVTHLWCCRMMFSLLIQPVGTKYSGKLQMIPLWSTSTSSSAAQEWNQPIVPGYLSCVSVD